MIAAGGDYSDTVTISAGSADGITANETVLNGDGLVGTVVATTPTTATVQLATDAGATVGIRMAGDGQIGALSGTADDFSGTAPLKLTLFSANASLKPGQELVTFGSVGGRPYVPGIPIGTDHQGDHPARLAHPDRPGHAVRRLHRPRRPRGGGQQVSRAVVLGRPLSGQFDGEPPAWRKALVVAALPVALFVAVVVQLTVVNRLPLPGGTAPDLVLLLVTAVAVCTSPMTGLLTGFAGGLALDVAPPATHYAGEYALVFCLAGYVAAWVAAASAAATGERNPVGRARRDGGRGRGRARRARPRLGLLLSDPNVTGPAIKHVLPGAIGWDLLLTPFAFFLVGWVAGLARPVTERAPRPEFIGAQRLAAGVQARVGRRRPGSAAGRHRGELRGQQPRAPGPEAAPSRRQIKIIGPNGPGRLWHRPAHPGRRADDQAQLRPLRQRAPVGRRPPSAAAGPRGSASCIPPPPSGRPAASAVSAAPRSSTSAAGRPRSRRPAARRARARAGSGPATAPGHAAARPRGPGKGWIRARGRSAAGPRHRHRGRLGLVVAGRRPPKAGWLRTDAHRPTAAKRATPGKGWLRKSRRPRANWYSSGPSTRWVRRSRSKDRWRTRRRSLSGAVMSGVRDLLPSGDRR